MTFDNRNNLLLIATDDGLIISPMDGQTWHKTLVGTSVTAVIAREGVILAGTLDGVKRSDDQGKTWRDSSHGLADRHIRWLAFHPQISDFELAGTASAGIFVSRDGGASWQRFENNIVWAEPLLAAVKINAITTNVEAATVKLLENDL